MSVDDKDDHGFWMGHDTNLKRATKIHDSLVKEFKSDEGGFMGDEPALLLVKREVVEKVTILKKTKLKKLGEGRHR